jgi:uncharacterized RmlC-like cupin family protein
MTKDAPLKVATLRTPDAEIGTRQALPNLRGITLLTTGAKNISMNLVIIPPGGKSVPHLHRDCETAIYILQGRIDTRYGKGLKFSEINEAGDFVYIPANLPHQPVNLSATEEARALVAHSAGDEQQRVEIYDPDSDV